ncbi:hypothetical protein [Salinibaculum salinum]|uniref:hypothetical protein n=1 Tax=Salinibaculum salinum TaxID=3131996 RepID=UPI0030ECAB8B
MPLQSCRSSSAARAQGQKSVLFCPTCEHESPVDGDWQVRARGETLVYGCPTCGESITERPTAGDMTSPVSSTSHKSSAGGSLLARSVRLAFAWAAWPCTPAECALSYVSDGRTDPTSGPFSSVA